jgi:hypothetical protein
MGEPTERRLTVAEMMILVSALAILLAMFTPTMRSLDAGTWTVIIIALAVPLYLLVSFTPLWVVLLLPRRRVGRGTDLYLVELVLALVLSLGLLILLPFALIMLGGPLRFR